MAKVRVVEGWAVCVRGVQRSGGAIVEVDAETASKWQALGWVQPTKAARGGKRPAKRPPKR